MTNALNKARAAQSVAKRKQYYATVAKTLAKDVPYVFLDHPNNAFAAVSRLKGFTYIPDGIIRAVGMTK